MKAQAGRKEGRKERRKEGRKVEWNGKSATESRIPTSRPDLSPPTNPRDSHRPYATIHPLRYGNARRDFRRKRHVIYDATRTVLLVRTRTDAVTRTKRSAKEYNSVGYKPRAQNFRPAGRPRTFLTFKRREIFRG